MMEKTTLLTEGYETHSNGKNAYFRLRNAIKYKIKLENIATSEWTAQTLSIHQNKFEEL